jgi:uncharacterized protein YndB with AHSA1/START domain
LLSKDERRVGSKRLYGVRPEACDEIVEFIKVTGFSIATIEKGRRAAERSKEMSGASQAGEEVRLEIRIDASRETVFALLTDSTQMKRWLAEIVEADARPGGVFRVSGTSGLTIEGTYLEVVPYQKVMFTWGGVEGLKPAQSTVEFLIEPDGTGSLVRLRIYRLRPACLGELRDYQEQLWNEAQRRFVIAAENTKPGDDDPA